jgi:AraC-like DNA-binding protein
LTQCCTYAHITEDVYDKNILKRWMASGKEGHRLIGRREMGRPGRHAIRTPLRYQISELHSRSREIIRQNVLGAKSVEIAENLGISPVTVNYTINSELGKARIEELQQAKDGACVDVLCYIKSKAMDAALMVEHIMQTGCENNQLKAAFDMLDRAGFAPVQKQQSVTAVLTGEDVAAMRQRALEAGMLAVVGG